MKVRSASFQVSAYGQAYRVDFMQGMVRVFNGAQGMVEYANTDNRWKPCATHCKALIQLAYGKKISSRHSQKKARETKPVLRIFAE